MKSNKGSVVLTGGFELIGGARGMLLSTACSRPVYRAVANR